MTTTDLTVTDYGNTTLSNYPVDMLRTRRSELGYEVMTAARQKFALRTAGMSLERKRGAVIGICASASALVHDVSTVDRSLDLLVALMIAGIEAIGDLEVDE